MFNTQSNSHITQIPAVPQLCHSSKTNDQIASLQKKICTIDAMYGTQKVLTEDISAR